MHYNLRYKQKKKCWVINTRMWVDRDSFEMYWGLKIKSEDNFIESLKSFYRKLQFDKQYCKKFWHFSNVINFNFERLIIILTI